MKTSDPRIEALKLRKQQLELDLKAINTRMAAIRSHYQQVGGFELVLQGRRHLNYKKNTELRPLQPQKEELQRQILAVRQEIYLIQTSQIAEV
jgi:hypothetical protein